MSARDLILGRLRATQHRLPDPVAPYRPEAPADLGAALAARARAVFATAEEITSLDDLPAAVARYLGPDITTLAVAAELRHLAWSAAGLTPAAPPGRAAMAASVAPVVGAIAETGTLILTSRDPHGPWPNLLADRHIAVVPRGLISATLEEAVARLAGNRLPRSLHLATGPSRTGDIEQTLELGAHGAVAVHLVLTP
ncbi:Lactate utilization protein C [Alphaproteobacteria bacterium SO-S41]|nr:Lactate utilization protein C [Alphaproteobacteria bacterium SO-S41]